MREHLINAEAHWDRSISIASQTQDYSFWPSCVGEWPEESLPWLYWGASLMRRWSFNRCATKAGVLARLYGEIPVQPLTRRCDGQCPAPYLQCMVRWGVLVRSKRGVYRVVKMAPPDLPERHVLTAQAWLVWAAMRARRVREAELDHASRYPELFPFDINFDRQFARASGLFQVAFNADRSPVLCLEAK